MQGICLIGFLKFVVSRSLLPSAFSSILFCPLINILQFGRLLLWYLFLKQVLKLKSKIIVQLSCYLLSQKFLRNFYT